MILGKNKYRLCGCGPFKGKEAKTILEKNKIGLIKFKKKKWENISKDGIF